MSTNDDRRELGNFRWGALGLFLAAFYAISDANYGPFKTTLLWVLIISSSYVCIAPWLDRRRHE